MLSAPGEFGWQTIYCFHVSRSICMRPIEKSLTAKRVSSSAVSYAHSQSYARRLRDGESVVTYAHHALCLDSSILAWPP